jgi:hypothetical protein
MMNNPGHINGGSVIGGLGVDPQDQVNYQGVKAAKRTPCGWPRAVVGEVTHSVPQWHQDVQIGQQAADSAPQQGASADLPAQHGLSDSGAQPDLCYGVHVRFPQPTTVLRINIIVSPTF